MSYAEEFQIGWCKDPDEACEGCPIPQLQRTHPELIDQVLGAIDKFGLQDVVEAQAEAETSYDSHRFEMLLAPSGNMGESDAIEAYDIVVGAVKQIAARHQPFRGVR